MMNRLSPTPRALPWYSTILGFRCAPPQGGVPGRASRLGCETLRYRHAPRAKDKRPSDLIRASFSLSLSGLRLFEIQELFVRLVWSLALPSNLAVANGWLDAHRSRRGPMRSVPPRGSGWVSRYLSKSGKSSDLMGLRLEWLARTHPLPRGGNDLMASSCQMAHLVL